jgi:hypothetical protein
MEPEPAQEKSVDEVLDEINWEKLGVEGVKEKAEPALAAPTKPPIPAEGQPPPPAKTEPPPPARAERSLPAEMELPAHMAVFQRGSDIEMVRKWFDWMTVFLTVFTVIWNGFIFANVRGMIQDGAFLVLLFPAIGVVLAYYTIARWLNRTRIVVSRDKITVRHGPLPWLGNKELEASNCQAIWPEEKEYRGGKGGTRRIYQVYASTHDGRRVKLLDGFTGLTYEQAHFIAQQLETYLGIRKIREEGRIFDWLR